MFKCLSAAVIGAGVALSLTGSAQAVTQNPYSLDLWTIQDSNPTPPPDGYYAGPNLSEWRAGEGLPDGGESDQSNALYFQKFTGTYTDSGAGAYIQGEEGITLTEIGYDFRNDSHCGAGAPRFNIYVEGMGTYYFSLGCYYGNRHSTPVPGHPNWSRVRFSDDDVYPSSSEQSPWPGFGNVIVSDIWIVFDEGLDQGNGYFYMDNINLNGTFITKPLPTLSIDNVSASEGSTPSADFTVSLSEPSEDTVTVDYKTASRSAVAGGDYQPVTGTLTFAPGTQTQTISVPIVNDSRDEVKELFVVNLTNPTNAVLAAPAAPATPLARSGRLIGARLESAAPTVHGTCTIRDNDAAPIVSVNNAAVTEGDNGQTVNAVFKVTLSAASGRTITVHYETANRGALAGADYKAVSGTLTFEPGTRSLTIQVPVIGDSTHEEKETFVMNLDNPVNATVNAPNNTLTDSRGLAFINDND